MSCMQKLYKYSVHPFFTPFQRAQVLYWGVAQAGGEEEDIFVNKVVQVHWGGNTPTKSRGDLAGASALTALSSVDRTELHFKLTRTSRTTQGVSVFSLFKIFYQWDLKDFICYKKEQIYLCTSRSCTSWFSLV